MDSEGGKHEERLSREINMLARHFPRCKIILSTVHVLFKTLVHVSQVSRARIRDVREEIVRSEKNRRNRRRQ